MSAVRRLVPLALLAGASAASLPAQVIRVRTVERATRPVAGALVSLRDDRGRAVAQSLTDEGGRALLRAPQPGRFRVRADRIGFTGITGAPVDLAVGDTAVLVIEMPTDRVVLPELSVASTRAAVCRVEREADGSLLATLWTEARKALAGTELTRAVQAPLLEITIFERNLDAEGRVRSEQSTTQQARSTRPFVTIEPSRLIAAGFVEERGGEIWYYGPDAALLLSDPFVETHCFQPVPSPDPASGLIGLRFEPARGRRVPEITGTLWLDRASAELRYLEFGYVNLDRRRASGREGGRVEFRRLPGGGWIVSDWVITMPQLVRVSGRTFDADKDSLVGLREDGGRAAVVDGGREIARNRAVVTGVVFDSTLGRPLDGVVVTLAGGAYRDTTDEAGRYRIETPTQGQFLVSYHHPRFESLGIGPRSGSATLTRGRLVTVDHVVPGFATLWAACAATALDRSARTLWGGVVRDTAGAPVAGARLDLSWGPLAAQRAVARADGLGRFRVCGAPAATEIWIRAPAPWIAEPHLTSLGADSVAVADVRLGIRAAAGAAAAPLTVTATGPGGAPVPGALVSLHPLPDTARTDPAGRAAFGSVPAGRYLVGVRALGFDLAAQPVTVEPGRAAAAAVALAPVAQTLATVEVTAAAPSRSARMAGFEDRRRAGLGRFLTREMIATQPAARVSDLLRRFTNLRLVALPLPCLGVAATSGRAGVGLPELFCQGQQLPPACFMAVYVDGMPYWRLGDGDPVNVDDFPPGTIEAIEVYAGASQLPQQFIGAGNDCGVVALWTRTGG